MITKKSIAIRATFFIVLFTTHSQAVQTALTNTQNLIKNTTPKQKKSAMFAKRNNLSVDTSPQGLKPRKQLSQVSTAIQNNNKVSLRPVKYCANQSPDTIIEYIPIKIDGKTLYVKQEKKKNNVVACST